jgi:hypothetical protein
MILENLQKQFAEESKNSVSPLLSTVPATIEEKKQQA